MAESGFFATAFRGFRKEDVLNYIDALNVAHCEEVAVLQQDLTALREQCDVLEEQLPAMQQELEALRVKAENAEASQRALEETKQRLTVFEEENRQLKAKLTAAQEGAAQCTRLQNQNAVLQQQLAAQQSELNTYEKMFGDSRDAAAFVRDHVDARLQESRHRTEKTLTEVEQMTARLTAELERVRTETAAIRQATAAADEKDAVALAAWFRQFEKKVSADTDTHFFR